MRISPYWFLQEIPVVRCSLRIGFCCLFLLLACEDEEPNQYTSGASNGANTAGGAQAGAGGSAQGGSSGFSGSPSPGEPPPPGSYRVAFAKTKHRCEDSQVWVPGAASVFRFDFDQDENGAPRAVVASEGQAPAVFSVAVGPGYWVLKGEADGHHSPKTSETSPRELWRQFFLQKTPQDGAIEVQGIGAFFYSDGGDDGCQPSSSLEQPSLMGEGALEDLGEEAGMLRYRSSWGTWSASLPELGPDRVLEVALFKGPDRFAPNCILSFSKDDTARLLIDRVWVE